MSHLVSLLLVAMLPSPAQSFECSRAAAAAEAGRDAKGYALRRFGKEGTAFDVTYPQLTGLKDEVVRKRVNDAIRKEAKEWQCHGGAGGEDQTFTVQTTVVRLDEQVFSYKLVFDYFCGGPYPDAHVEARTYDLESGKLVQIEDLFKPGFDSAATAKLILESGPVDPECKEAYEMASTFHFFLVDHSIVFFPSLPHVVQACANEHAFAISHLMEHLRPGTLLTRSESH